MFDLLIIHCMTITFDRVKSEIMMCTPGVAVAFPYKLRSKS